MNEKRRERTRQRERNNIFKDVSKSISEMFICIEIIFYDLSAFDSLKFGKCSKSSFETLLLSVCQMQNQRAVDIASVPFSKYK